MTINWWDCEIVGIFDNNSVLNTLVNDVEFLDGAVKQYSANVIAMNILVQVESAGRNFKTLYGIVDYKRYESVVSKSDAFITTNRGVINIRQTTIGCKNLIQWKDGTTTWIYLKILKYSNPYEVADFVVARGVSDETLF